MYKSGSKWGRWDLHIHTASSYDAYKGSDSDNLLVEKWRENNLVAVAITDHVTIDSNRISNLTELASGITVFPGVELRCDKGTKNLHIIIIFPNGDKKNLENLSNKFDVFTQDEGKPSGIKSEKNWKEVIYWDFEKIIEFAKKNNGIISIHAGKSKNGLEGEIPNTNKFLQEIKKEIAGKVDILEINNTKEFDSYQEIIFKKIGRKPLVICSDNHDPRDYKIKEKLWIKSNPTFNGLKQVLYHPEERIYIGDTPPLLDNLIKNKKNYIKNINIKKIEDSKNSETWFTLETPISLNAGLNAIIGSKGSGKSALSDIIAHACGSKTMEEASFLNEKRFRKSPEKYASDYECELKWEDEKINNSNLGEKSQIQVEEAQYLPQKYIETVCNELDNQFQDEINDVIFSYIELNEKGNATNLKELIDIKSSEIRNQIKRIKIELDEINQEIIKLEDKEMKDYKENIENNLKKLEEDYKRHDNNKPKEVLQPEISEDTTGVMEIKNLTKTINEKKAEQERIELKITGFNNQKNKIHNFNIYIENIEKEINKMNKIIKEYEIEDSLKEEFLISYTPSIEKIKTKIKEINSEKTINLDIESKLKEEIEELEIQKNNLISKSNKEEKEYQKYLKDIEEWEKEKKRIKGSPQLENSIEYYEKEKNYINNQLSDDLEKKNNERTQKVKEIFENIEKIVEIYKNIYYPIEIKLEEIIGKLKEKIEFSSDIKLIETDFAQKLFKFISAKVESDFKGKDDGYNKMKKNIEEVNFNSFESINTFISKVISGIKKNKDKLKSVVNDREAFYKKLTNLDYINVEYSLKMGGRSLKELSPGERGILLLVFYLALNKNEIPLIIDQPEDNLDNESVFDKLVPCILEAKKRRQVIIVTHNPNIAIACDAEQIIHCSIDKNTNQITYSSGSIEEKEIRKKLINILEGTKPAFLLRELKYEISELEI